MADFLAQPVEDRHLPQLAEFLCSVFGGSTSSKLDAFERQWELNPAWNVEIPKGWIVTTASGDILAHTTNIPQIYRNGANSILCCATGGTAVHPEWRGRGLSRLVGSAFLRQRADLLIAVGSTPIAWNMWVGLGMHPLKRHWGGHRIIFGSVRSLISDEVSMPGVDILGRAIDVGFGCVVELVKGFPSKLVTVAVAHGFSETDDDDIAKCVAQNSTLYAVRDARILNWLYFSTPLVRAARVVLSARAGNTLLGYLALKRDRNRLQMLECRCRNADPEIASNLLWSLRDYMVTNQCSFASIWPYSKMIETAMPHVISRKRGQTPPTYCYVSNVGPIAETMWDSAPGDGDISLY